MLTLPELVKHKMGLEDLYFHSWISNQALHGDFGLHKRENLYRDNKVV
ncbi:hypothetical protein BWGOE4_30430 [Bacillus mycoides]|nr:hypothetical protein BWGOE2_09100 [Bacillus mycoides]OFD49350.1 hypothetical protein BWGOE1_09940 [Bacillus mycoides]OFD57617.1 hypothetical protein BWGOE4_30430 [Bacillus mycoides]OFD63616.1 hypothetical protein BWGOE7_30980 [Bacillus mycoides]OFD64267.1 hypothetical protein BWGOE6_09580 [Bacillus mycoides]